MLKILDQSLSIVRVATILEGLNAFKLTWRTLLA
jgi:hypothetical protein